MNHEIHSVTTQLYLLTWPHPEREQARKINPVSIDRVHSCKR